MPEIIPAIMPKTIVDISAKVSLVKKLVSYVQIDVMDGIFVPNKSWPYSAWSEFQELVKKNTGLPFWQDINYEFDLMVKNSPQILNEIILLGAQRIIFHIESSKKEELKNLIDKAKEAEVEVGISLNNDTPLETILPFVDKIDFVQLMGIARIGFQGEPFDERVIERIKKLKKDYQNLAISIDGGVNFETAPFLVGAGADRLVSGSAIFESGDIVDAICKLKMIQ
ncbi:MAG: hypothetical protein AAB488_01510 [Patescibacteria group bacterium]